MDRVIQAFSYIPSILALPGCVLGVCRKKAGHTSRGATVPAAAADDTCDSNSCDSNLVVDSAATQRRWRGGTVSKVYQGLDGDEFSCDDDDDDSDVFEDAKEYFRGGWGELQDSDSLMKTIVYEDALDWQAASADTSDVTQQGRDSRVQVGIVVRYPNTLVVQSSLTCFCDGCSGGAKILGVESREKLVGRPHASMRYTPNFRHGCHTQN